MSVMASLGLAEAEGRVMLISPPDAVLAEAGRMFPEFALVTP